MSAASFPFPTWTATAGWLAAEATLVVVVAVASQALLRDPSARRSLWRAVLIALAVLFGAEFTGHTGLAVERIRTTWHSFRAKPSPPAAPVVLPPIAVNVEPPPFTAPALPVLIDDTAGIPTEVPPVVPAAPVRSTEPLPATSGWLAQLWMFGFGALVLRLAWTQAGFAILRWRHFKRAAAVLEARVLDLAVRLGFRRRVRVLESVRLRAPAAFGWLRPAVGVPGDFTARFTPPQQDVMLAHELAHLVAHDLLWQLLADLVTAVIWWHPLVWIARRQHRAAAEQAADEASRILADGPVTLAECLLALGREATAEQIGALGMAGLRSGLGRRVEHLLSLPRTDWQPASRARLALQTTAALAGLAALALLPGCAANRTASEAPSHIVGKWWHAKTKTPENQPRGAALLMQAKPQPKPALIQGQVLLNGVLPAEQSIPLPPPVAKALPRPVLTTRNHLRSPDGGLADVLVYVKRGLEGQTFAPPTNTHVIRIQRYEYQPYITAVQAGQPIRWEADVNLNFHPTPTNAANREFNRVLEPARPVEAVFSAPEFFLRTKDDVHHWMFGYLSVLPHPYFAVTDAEGRFRFPQPLPPGKYTLAALHRRAGESTRELVVDGRFDQTKPVVFALGPALGRDAIQRKLAETRLPEITYDGIPLPVVLRMLEQDTKKYDPAKQGVSFEMRNLEFIEFSPPTPGVTGRTPPAVPTKVGKMLTTTAPQPLSRVRVPGPDLDTVLIKIDTVLRDVSVLDALDAIVKTADVHAPDGQIAGLQYTIETNRVVFQARATPAAFASPTKATLTPRQRALLQRLDNIVIPEVSYDGLPLPEVIKLLAQDAKRYDPENKGFNLLASSGRQTGGIPGNWPDHETILIQLSSPLRRLTVRQVLEVICQTAQVKRPDGQTAGLRFTVEDYGIVLTPRVLGQPFAPPRLVDRPAGAAVRAKLDQIILPRVSYDGLPLPEVIKQLDAAARKHDPDQRGVNLLATACYPDVPQHLEPSSAVLDPVTGIPMAPMPPGMTVTIPLPTLDKNGFPIGPIPTVEVRAIELHTLVDTLIQPDLETVLVRVTQPLTNAPLRKVLDAIVKHSEVSGGGAITYRVEDHGVLLTPDYSRKGFQKPPAPTVFAPPHSPLPLATPVTPAAPGPAGPVNPALAREHCDRLEALVKAVRTNPATTAQDLANVTGLIEQALAEYSASLKPDAPELARLRKLLEGTKPPAPKPGASLSPVAPPAVSTANTLDISVGRQLFVDDFLIASNSLKRTWHQPVLFSATPLLASHDQSPPRHPFFESVWFDSTNQHFMLGLANGTRFFRDYHSPSGTNWVPMHAQSHQGPLVEQPHRRVTTDYESLRVSLSRDAGKDGIQFGFARAGTEPVPQAARPVIPLPVPTDGSRWTDMHPLRNGILVVGRNLYCYFGGKVTNYGPRIILPGAHQQQAAVGLATLRRDGFASLDAGPEGAVMTTKPVTFTGRFMFVNMKTNAPDGELRIEVLDAKGNPLERFSRANCIPMAADQTLMSVSWQNQTNGLAMLVGRPVCFRFHLKNASLYSFWVGPGQLGRSMGRVAGGGPHFTNDVDTIGNRSYSPLPVKLGALVVGDYLKVELSYREDATNKTRQHQGAIASSGYFPLPVPRLNRVPVLAGKTIDEAQELIREMLLAAKLENPVVAVTKTQPPPASPPGTEFFAPRGSYLVRVGDELGVSVFGRDDLKTQVEVQPDGSVKLPLVGALKVEGKSLSEAREIIKAAYQPAHLSPAHVTVTVTRYGTPPRMSAILPTMPDLVVLHPPTLEKLARLRLPEVTYDGMALPAVLASLEQIAARQHPPGTGVGFEIQKGLFVGDDPTLSKPGQTSPPRTNANGSVFSFTINPDAKVLRSRIRLNFDMDAVSVKFPSILRDASALDVLDAIVKSANYPIRFTIETNRVVFWQRPTNEPSPTPKPPAPKPAAPRGALPDLEKHRAVVLREIEDVQDKFNVAQRELAAAQRNDPPAEVERIAKVVAQLDARYKSATAELARLDTESKYLSVTRKGLNLVRREPTVNPGDALQLIVAEDDSYSAIYPVKRDGSITVKGVGRVPVGGRRLSDAQAAVKAVLEATQLPKATVTLEFVGEPELTNTVASATNDQRVIYLAGEFITPGPLKLAEGESLTLTNVLLRSGGITPNGDLTRLKLLRIENGKGAVEEVNVAAILSGTRPATNRALLPGDIIMVPAYPPVVFVTGSVGKPGQQPLAKDEKLTAYAAILRAGGFAPGASLTNCYIVRDAGNGEKAQLPFNIKEVQKDPAKDIAVQAGDIVVVPSSRALSDAEKQVARKIEAQIEELEARRLRQDEQLRREGKALKDAPGAIRYDQMIDDLRKLLFELELRGAPPAPAPKPGASVPAPSPPAERGEKAAAGRLSGTATNADAANPSPQPSPLSAKREREPESAATPAPVAADVRRLTSPQPPDANPKAPATISSPLPDGFSESLRIEGEIQYWRSSSPTSSNLASARQFVAILDTNRNWSLSTKPIVGPNISTNIGARPQTVIGDDQSISILEQFSLADFPGLDERKKAMEASRPQASVADILSLTDRRFWRAVEVPIPMITNRITILPKRIPTMDGASFAAGVWIPYFSGSRVDWKTVQEFPRVFSMRPMSDDHGKCRVIVDLDKATVEFPRAISFLRVEGAKRLDPNRKANVPESSPVFVGQTIEAQFRVIAITNYQGKVYPRISQTDYFKSTRDASASASGAYVWVRVEAHSFTRTNSPIILPTVAVTGKTHVLDDRLTVNGDKRITYVVDKKVPDLNSKEEQQKLKQQQDMRKALMEILKGKNPKTP